MIFKITNITRIFRIGPTLASNLVGLLWKISLNPCHISTMPEVEQAKSKPIVIDHSLW